MAFLNITSMNITKVLAKAAGVAGVGLVAYDSHIAGKIESHSYGKNNKAESITERYLDDLKLDSPSSVKAGVKSALFHYSMDENLTGFFSGISGYFKGFGSMLVSNAVPFALSVGTLLTKGLTSKLCGAGLAAYGGIFLLQEMFGIGKPR